MSGRIGFAGFEILSFRDFEKDLLTSDKQTTMKGIFGQIILISTLLLGLGMIGKQHKAHVQSTSDDKATTVEEVSHYVLVELFTSQGCSSCPPADRLLAELADEAQAGDLSVVTLSYHVDYWNRLGWTDPYSQALFSNRQRQYARKLADQRVYTPQMVIQGQTGHVGSRERDVRDAIQTALQKDAQTSIELTKQVLASGQLNIGYTLQGQTDNLLLQIALVDRQINNEVPRGENRGRHLEHVQVVRQLQQIAAPETTGGFSVDPGILDDPAQGQLVVFAQDEESWEVLGVAMMGLE